MHIGRPSEVMFPRELIGQGVSIVLSGLNNTLAFQSNPDWIWPLWYERQRDPEDQGFIPTGMNLITSNITMRNWISLGVPGSEVECMVDPAGMLTLQEYSWSMFPYLRMENTLHLPTQFTGGQLQQELEEGCWPSVTTQYNIDPRLQWSSQIEVVQIGNEELVVITHKLKNCGDSLLDLTFGITLRPYNQISISHINKIKFKNSLWRINHCAALWTMEEPHRVLTADRNGPDPIHLCESGETRNSKISKSGVAAGVAEWSLELNQNETRIITTVATLRKKSLDPLARFQKPTTEALEQAQAQIRERWKTAAACGLQLQIPDARWMTAWHAVRNRIFVFDDGTHFSPGTYHYHHFWIRDNAFLFMAHMQMGLLNSLPQKLEKIISVQNREGFFRSQDGEWDSNGQAIFTIVNYVKASGNLDVLKSFWPAIWKGAMWISTMRNKSRQSPGVHFGLMPAGFSAEHFGPNDHYYWDNFWSLQGINDAIWVADVLGHVSEKSFLCELSEEYSEDLNASIHQAMQRNSGRGLPSSPYRKVDSSAIGNLVAIAPLDLIKPEVDWLGPTIETLMNESLSQGMFYQKIIHTGLNSYLSIQLARALLARNDPRWQGILQSVLDHATSTWTWPEAIHPRTGGGCMGDGDHGWAAAELLSFTISLLVRVQDGQILLGMGIPESWYTPTMDVYVENVVTRHGTISWRLIGQGENAELSWSIERNQAQRKIPAIFALPVPLGFASPHLSSFAQGRSILALDNDHGTFVIPLPKENR